MLNRLVSSEEFSARLCYFSAFLVSQRSELPQQTCQDYNTSEYWIHCGHPQAVGGSLLHHGLPMGCKRISIPVPEAPPRAPSSMTFVSPGRSLSHILIPFLSYRCSDFPPSSEIHDPRGHVTDGLSDCQWWIQWELALSGKGEASGSFSPLQLHCCKKKQNPNQNHKPTKDNTCAIWSFIWTSSFSAR